MTLLAIRLDLRIRKSTAAAVCLWCCPAEYRPASDGRWLEAILARAARVSWPGRSAAHVGCRLT